MHNNYYFLRQLAHQLEARLNGSTVVSCFSQDKDELVIELNNATESFFIKASLLPDLQCLSFPTTFHRARKNSVDLFSEILMKRVEGIRTYTNERSLGLQLLGGWVVLFKMHGKQSNVILIQDQEVKDVFRHNFPADLTLRPVALDREINWNTQDLPDDPEAWEKRFITFGKPVWNYLGAMGFTNQSSQEKGKLVLSIKAKLENPKYYLVETPKSFQLNLLPASGVVQQFTDPIEAVNVFVHRFHARLIFEREKISTLSSLRGQIKQCEAFIANAHRRLAELSEDRHYARWADLIMANLHRIPGGVAEASLEDFHNPGRNVVVRLRKELSPQKNAEVYYRKAKNQTIERDNLTEALEKKQAQRSALVAREVEVASCKDPETLKPLVRALTSQKKDKEKRESLPYRSYTCAGFTILVGKNAAANDALTLHHTFKEDLWLHARDVAGSHVVIKHQSGKAFPKDVIEYAASLAAWHSRRKNESLCPVSMTPAKYVRKRKGDPPGTVVLQQEKVMMVPPKAPNDLR